ncbi:MAG: hypothetical protein A3H98_10665 [Bacteroidetes bacterium RIFCSPLOWO2_02_FULL_36_8]|nr:MAG: hypothetical protein A3H98_10665 [Bacteroidetes bacterium RIFCSPLOWO2_02_FULL_36_8]OFY69761.1 MAG: hypothetical protein A3G23_11450 [Bacteroidetes bacterium RIFCSPLOWO2_12_FULL_37_12]
MKKTTLLLIILLGTGSLNYAQNPEWEEITREEITKEFIRIHNWYLNTKNYSLQVKHSLFKDPEQKIPEDKSVGYFIKHGVSYHNNLMDIHTIQNDKYKIVLDTSQKLIMVSNAGKDNLWNTLPVEPAKDLALVSVIKKYCDDSLKKYRIEFELESGISVFEIHLNKENLPVKLIICYRRSFSHHSYTENNTVKNPKVEIEFTDYLIDENYYNSEKEFDETEYFMLKDDKLMPTEKFKGYEIKDMRVNQ